MRFQIHAETLGKHIQSIGNIVEKRQTSPILGYFLLQTIDDKLVVNATDLELEIVTSLQIESGDNGSVTVPAKKFADLCRSIPGGELIDFQVKGQFAQIKTNSSRFSLNTLPVDGFPVLETKNFENQYRMPLLELKALLECTQFAMAVQDVRAFLNGMLLEFDQGNVKSVATDAHRLALCEKPIEKLEGANKVQIILPRKGVMELIRMLDTVDTLVDIRFNQHHFQVSLPDTQLTTKLIDGNYPEYQRVLPQGGQNLLRVDREEFKQSLVRTSILASEKYKGVLLKLNNEKLNIIVSNSEQETAEVEMAVEYAGDNFEVGFNISYLLDVVNILKKDIAELRFIDAASSCLVTEPDNDESQYVVMPMRV